MAKKGFVSRVEDEDYENFKLLCSNLEVFPAAAIRCFVEYCVKNEKIPLEFLPEEIVHRIKKAVENKELYQRILEAK